jgi:diaminopimelate epimerase
VDGASPAEAGHGVESSLRLTKHQGVGNDFLVVLEPVAGTIGPEEVRVLCDRHRGIGADGLIVGLRGTNGADLEMVLMNADGSSAEMSGNGIRCLVQAAVAARMTNPGTVVVDTGAGRRQVEYSDLGDGLGWAEVDMGPAALGKDLPLDELPGSLCPPGAVLRARAVDVGNPHVVLLAGERLPDTSVVGPMIDGSAPAGANVELVRAVDRSSLEIEVWERGVGLTGSCGTGACAAAAAARSWGLVGDEVDVASSGGVLRVRLSPDTVTLSGPARTICEITVEKVTISALVVEQGEEVVAAL